MRVWGMMSEIWDALSKMRETAAEPRAPSTEAVVKSGWAEVKVYSSASTSYLIALVVQAL